ncbi:hypothetical protein ACFQZT_33420 [Paenibacillus sp. GCM10027628]|uniref:hypothetical protein n=1 Tax=Paenibacillus sp. GCM10027628 TaxID=3273413 RepID=UPI0036312028
MEIKEESMQLSGTARLLYFGLIPLLFTTLMVGTGVYMINHGKGETFAGLLTHAGESVLKAGKSVITKKPATPAPAAAGTASSGSTSTGAGSAGPANATAAGTTAATPGGTNTASAQPGSTAPAFNGIPASAPAEDLKQQTDAAASQYAAMTAAQAAGILDNMTLKDEVFNMLGMKPPQRANILAKMDPKKAAAVSLALKDFQPVSSDNAADVQKKLDSLPGNPQPVDELAKTYSQMPAASAASLITELMNTDAKEAVSIMASLDAGTRAGILAAMSSSKDPAGLKAATAVSQLLLTTK